MAGLGVTALSFWILTIYFDEGIAGVALCASAAALPPLVAGAVARFVGVRLAHWHAAEGGEEAPLAGSSFGPAQAAIFVCVLLLGAAALVEFVRGNGDQIAEQDDGYVFNEPSASPGALVLVGRSDFQAIPSAEELSRHFPERAMAEGVEGHATLRCMSGNDSVLSNCVVLYEEPTGYGFGEAAIAVATQSMRPHVMMTEVEFDIGFRLAEPRDAPQVANATSAAAVREQVVPHRVVYERGLVTRIAGGFGPVVMPGWPAG